MLYVQNYLSISRRLAAPFFPLATNNHTQSMRVDENIRFYANIIEFNEGTIGTSATIGTTDTSGIRHLNK